MVLGITALATAVLATVSAGSPAAAAIRVADPTPTVAGLQPANGEVVGVAHPVIVTFTGPVTDRAAAEKSITISSSPALTGSFTWVDDAVAQWNPDELWPARTEITALAGGFSTSFETGAAVVGVADLSAHTFTVTVDDQVVREMPASMGKPGFETPIGTFPVLEKQRKVVFDSRTIGIPLNSSEGYLINGEYAVRITWGGVYVHSAPWSVGKQGYANVSHGCINLSPDNAAWYFDNVRKGDPVIVQA